MIRWNHPVQGLVTPEDIFPRAKSAHQMIWIGNWVLQHACRQNQRWQAAGLPAVPVAVNLSSAQFLHQGIFEMIRETLAETGLDANFLEIEISETLSMRDPQVTLLILQQLQQLGIKASIDDFGTGYSSLRQLKKLPINRLKIDISIIQGIGSDPDDLTIASSIISLAKNMGIGVIAEGVETEAQLQLLKQLQCDQAQGFYLGLPMQVSEMQTLLENITRNH